MRMRDDSAGRLSNAAESEMERVKVLYIMGMTRSGSTILDRIIGQCDGFFSLGESYSIWDLNVLQNQRCGCGSRFDECGVWTRIFANAYGGIYQDTALEMSCVWNRYLRTRHIPRMFIPFGGINRKRCLDNYKQQMERLYRAIRRVTGARVIIDSSKFPTYARLLTEMPGIELFVVHIVRDPRAVAYSWLRRKKEPSSGDANELMQRMTPAGTAKLWGVWNVAGELAFRGRNIPYLRIRYEDFIAEPKSTVERILDLVHEPSKGLPFTGEMTIELGIDHTLAGNPNRFATGVQELSLDDAWKTKLKSGHRRLVTSITWPLLKRYGYELTI